VGGELVRSKQQRRAASNKSGKGILPQLHDNNNDDLLKHQSTTNGGRRRRWWWWSGGGLQRYFKK
jgi:hypothetical protein